MANYPIGKVSTYHATLPQTQNEYYRGTGTVRAFVDGSWVTCGTVQSVDVISRRVRPSWYSCEVYVDFTPTSIPNGQANISLTLYYDGGSTGYSTQITIVPDGIYYNGKCYLTDETQSASTYRTKSMVSEECGINTFEAVIYSEELPDVPVTTMFGEIYAPLGADCIFVDGGTDIRDYTTFAPVEYWRDAKLVGKYYLTSIERVSTNWFKISAVSPIGIIDKMVHKGGLYSNKTFVEMCQDIIGNTISYSIDTPLQSATLVVNGWLPYSTIRENLNQLLFAVGAAATYDNDGNMKFKYNEPDVSVDIDDANIYVGGSIDYPTKASKVTMVEHSWIVDNNVEADVLYKSADPVSNVLVVFDKPYHSLDGGGFTIDSTLNNANCCRVSGTGTLTGKAYAHIQRELVQTDPNITAEEMRVEDATLVSSLNSLNCLRRVYNYYRNADEVSYDIVSNGAFKCGDLISFQDPFGEMKSGYVKEMDETISGVIKSTTKIATNWQPKYLGNTYEHSMIVKASDLENGTWSVPSAMQGNPAMVILFSGFGGGSGGYNGGNGRSISPTRNKYTMGYNETLEGGFGGAGGLTGAYPNYIICEYESLASSYSVSFGQGGTGGSVGGGAGGVGGNSTFGTYNTNNGTQLTGRYINLLTGAIVADKGADGYAGGDGGTTQSISSTSFWNTGESGRSVGAYLGGSGIGTYVDYDANMYRHGASGGGAAYGTNGSSAYRDQDAYMYTHGGNGANAVAPANAVIGKSGDGGNGGGGGGGGGIDGYEGSDGYYHYEAHGGTGGNGSVGGKGSDGFALIYY